ncbi:hypothetical protein YC2023_077963 [Brassica napus]
MKAYIQFIRVLYEFHSGGVLLAVLMCLTICHVSSSLYKTCRVCLISPENFSASSDLAGKLVSVVRSHRKLVSIRREIVSFVFRQRTHQHRQISQENSSSLSKLAGKLVRITGSRRIDYRIVEKKIIVVVLIR